jgi:CHC2-type zinc finger protein
VLTTKEAKAIADRIAAARYSRTITQSSGLDEILPPDYFRVLAGIDVPERGGMVLCPLHEERTPSCQVYATAERGWHCFGCGRGNNVYHVAAELWGTSTRGRDFIELRRELERRFHLT